MNRRPSQSRIGYDSFSPRHTAHFTASTPSHDFFDSRKKRPLFFRLAFFLFCFLLITLIANFAVNRFVHVKKLSVPVRNLSTDFDGYTILHISDLKGASFGSKQQMLFFALGDEQYDAVALTGDMLSQKENAQPLYALIDTLKAHNPSAPIYFIAGDSDPDPASTEHFAGGSPFAPWVLGAQQRGARLLSSPQAITREDSTLWLTNAGNMNIDIDTMQEQFEQQYIRAMRSGDENEIELATYNLKWLEETRAARRMIAPEDAIITLTHVPPTQQEMNSFGSSSLWGQIDLMLCGHYLGGMIRLPLLGPLFIPSSLLPRYGVLPGSSAFCGMSRISGTSLHISSGLGSANDDYPSFFFRLFNPPTVTLLTLTPSTM